MQGIFHTTPVKDILTFIFWSLYSLNILLPKVVKLIFMVVDIFLSDIRSDKKRYLHVFEEWCFIQIQISAHY